MYVKYVHTNQQQPALRGAGLPVPPKISGHFYSISHHMTILQYFLENFQL